MYRSDISIKSQIQNPLTCFSVHIKEKVEEYLEKYVDVDVYCVVNKFLKLTCAFTKPLHRKAMFFTEVAITFSRNYIKI